MFAQDVLLSLNAYEIVLDKNLDFAFFTHNKNAQTSVNRFLLKDRTVVKKDNLKLWNLVKREYERNIDNKKIITFTIIRNPFDRYVSAFCYLQKMNIIDKKIDINNWTARIFKIFGPAFDPHFTHQEKYHKSILNLNFDFILNFDNLQQEWSVLAKKIKASETLPHANASAGKKFNLTTRSQKIIEDIYYDDFQLFNKLQ